jgi:DNA-binding XRE family transcriptional regulator
MLGERIRKIREKHQLTQRELGALCGLGDKQIWRYENGLSEPTSGAQINPLSGPSWPVQLDHIAYDKRSCQKLFSWKS